MLDTVGIDPTRPPELTSETVKILRYLRVQSERIAMFSQGQSDNAFPGQFVGLVEVCFGNEARELLMAIEEGDAIEEAHTRTGDTSGLKVSDPPIGMSLANQARPQRRAPWGDPLPRYAASGERIE